MKRNLAAALLCFMLNLSLELILPKLLLADSDEFCGDVTSSLQPPYIPTTGTFRVLIVFVQFQDDVFDGPPYCVGDPNAWPSSLHSIPAWATGTNLMHSSVSSSYASGSMSDYYQVMSNGNFDFIGDVFPELYLTPQPKSYYTISAGRGRGWLNQQIIDWMDTHPTNPVNFADYDNDNDGDVDIILFIYRNSTKLNHQQSLRRFSWRVY